MIGKNLKIHIKLNHFAVHLKLTQHFKSTVFIFHFKKRLKRQCEWRDE